MDPALVAENLADVRRRIVGAGGDLDRVRIVAVTKTFGPEAVRCAAALGISHVGENYVDELHETRRATSDLELSWHYLGALQTNKIARVARIADVISSVSRLREVRRLAQVGAGTTIDVQVDFTGYAARNGVAPTEVNQLVNQAREAGLVVRGLMTVAPPDAAAAAFAAMAELAQLSQLHELSMGMSDDLELAVAAGSTELRIGRALFGARAARSALT